MDKQTKIIVFEGLDGVGKSTLIEKFTNHIEKTLGKTVALAKMPSYDESFTKQAFEITSKLKQPLTKTMVMLSSTLVDFENHIQTKIGKVDYILVDRFFYSTFLYQMRKIEDPIIKDSFYSIIRRSFVPEHFVILLEETKTVRTNRINKSKRETDALKDTYDNYTVIYHEELTSEYQEIVRRLNPDRHLIIQGKRRSPNQLMNDIIEKMENLEGILFQDAQKELF